MPVVLPVLMLLMVWILPALPVLKALPAERVSSVPRMALVVKVRSASQKVLSVLRMAPVERALLPSFHLQKV